MYWFTNVDTEPINIFIVKPDITLTFRLQFISMDWDIFK